MASLGHELKECLKTYNLVSILVVAYGSVNHTQTFSVIIAKHHRMYSFSII